MIINSDLNMMIYGDLTNNVNREVEGGNHCRVDEVHVALETTRTCRNVEPTVPCNYNDFGAEPPTSVWRAIGFASNFGTVSGGCNNGEDSSSLELSENGISWRINKGDGVLQM